MFCSSSHTGLYRNLFFFNQGAGNYVINICLIHVSWCLHCVQIYGHTWMELGVIILLFFFYNKIDINKFNGKKPHKNVFSLSRISVRAWLNWRNYCFVSVVSASTFIFVHIIRHLVVWCASMCSFPAIKYIIVAEGGAITVCNTGITIPLYWIEPVQEHHMVIST